MVPVNVTQIKMHKFSASDINPWNKKPRNQSKEVGNKSSNSKVQNYMFVKNLTAESNSSDTTISELCT